MDIELGNEVGTPKFIIETIEKSEPPKGVTGTNWFRYTVAQGGHKITGFKSGTLKNVTEHVENFIYGLNERFARGISPNAHSARGRK
jgi:hypothetical protein